MLCSVLSTRRSCLHFTRKILNRKFLCNILSLLRTTETPQPADWWIPSILERQKNLVLRIHKGRINVLYFLTLAQGNTLIYISPLVDKKKNHGARKKKTWQHFLFVLFHRDSGLSQRDSLFCSLRLHVPSDSAAFPDRALSFSAKWYPARLSGVIDNIIVRLLKDSSPRKIN